MGCLAVMGDPGTPAWVTDFLLPTALDDYKQWSGQGWAGGGAWKEGPNYGGYTVRYLAPLVHSLITATGNDAGISSLPGVLEAPRFMLGMMGPNVEYFYWDDTRDVPEAITQYMALASLANDGAAVWGIKSLALSILPTLVPNNTATTSMDAPVGLLYFTPIGSQEEYEALPRALHWEYTNAVTLRSGWSDPNATFMGWKGLNTTWNWAHTHLDGGSFVFQTEGQWFAQDLGPDSYALPAYFSPKRFTLYRTGTIGHNTLSFGGANAYCVPESTYSSDCPIAPMILFNSTIDAVRVGGESGAHKHVKGAKKAATKGIHQQKQKSLRAHDDSSEGNASVSASVSAFEPEVFSIVDLTPSYAPIGLGIASAQRGFIASASARQLITVDEISITPSFNASLVPPVWWSMHTVANVSIAADGLSAVLSTWNVSSMVTVAVIEASTSCPGAYFNLTAINLQAPYFPTPGVQRLTLIAPQASACNRLVVTIGVEPVTDLQVRPLAEWAEQGPLA